MYKLFHTFALFIGFFAFSANLLAQNAFITTWKTTDGTITIPTIPEDSLTYNYEIEWTNLSNPGVGDGSDSGLTGNKEITGLNNNDIYEISISGAFPAIYFLGGTSEKDKIQTIDQWGDIKWETMYFAFYNCSNLTLNAEDAPDLQQATSLYATFALATSLNSDLDNWDVSTITNMLGTFFRASAFNGDISNWNVYNVTNMSQMFEDATSFNNNISNWYTGNVTNMNSMFSGASSFNQNLNDWSVSSVLNMSSMFQNATAFNSPLNDWFTYQAQNMANMFSGASSFDQPLDDWNIGDVTNMSGMLDNCGMSKLNYDATLKGWESSFSTPTGITLGATGLTYCNGADSRTTLTGTAMNWIINGDALVCDPFITTWQTTDNEITIPTPNFGSETYFYNISWNNTTNPGVGDGSISGQTGNYTITGLSNGDIYEISISGDFPRIYFQNFNLSAEDRAKILSIEQWGDQEWTSMSGAFSNCTNLISNATDSPILINAITLNGMFEGATSFTGDLSNWEVSTIEDMSSMFENATSFNGDLNNWEVNNVTQMGSMFSGASSFNSNLDNWDVSNVNYMSSMFNGASAFNRNLNSWEVDNVSSMNAMFADATSFNGEIGDWSVNNVSSMSRMFNGASSFNRDLSDWNVGNVNRMNEMFANATSFNSDISDWDVRNVTEMNRMFNGATSFNRDLNDWNVSEVRNMGGMFWDATSFDQNLENWDISSVVPFEIESNGPDGLDSLFTNSGMSTLNYDSTLIGWSTLSAGETQIPQAINLGAQNLTYCSSFNERSQLVEDFDWTIYDNGPKCPVPTTQASNITFSNVSLSRMDVSWTNGNGTNSLVIVKEENEVNTNPDDLISYSANAALGNGDELGSGNFVVYNGNGNSFTLTGLSEGTTYHLRIYEYNGTTGLEAYNITSTSGNPAFQTTLAAPKITSFTPVSAGTGMNVTISGSGFTETSLVSFGGTNAASFTVDADSVITALVGEGSTGEVLVSNPAGTATQDGFEYIPSPELSSFDPVTASPGDTINIIGANLSNTNSISFGGVNATSFTIISDTQISAVVGEGSTGQVSVSTPGGTASLDGFMLTYSQISIFSTDNDPINHNQNDPINLGTSLPGETTEKQFIILNSGNADLIISNITSSEESFEIIAVSDTINPGSPAQFTLKFDPAEIGIYESEINIRNNSFNSPEFNFTVIAERAGINIINNETDSVIISNQDINLGSTFINVDVDKNFIIENLSSRSTIEISSIESNNPVFQIINAPSSIAPSSSEEFTVRLNANEIGGYNGIVTINTILNTFSFQVVGEVLPEGSTEIKVFNVVTPNGDGRHDFLQIENITEYPSNIVSIFNRWGNKVFEINNYNNSARVFKGLSDDGEELINGNYYYVIDKGNGEKRISGFLLIKR